MRNTECLLALQVQVPYQLTQLSPWLVASQLESIALSLRIQHCVLATGVRATCNKRKRAETQRADDGMNCPGGGVPEGQERPLRSRLLALGRCFFWKTSEEWRGEEERSLAWRCRSPRRTSVVSSELWWFQAMQPQEWTTYSHCLLKGMKPKPYFRSFHSLLNHSLYNGWESWLCFGVYPGDPPDRGWEKAHHSLGAGSMDQSSLLFSCCRTTWGLTV